jgi:hypothetical protein
MGGPMAGNNKVLRRAIVAILWESQEPLSKEEIIKRVVESKDFKNMSPSSATVGTILNKNNPQVIKSGTIRLFCGDGRWRRKPLFSINHALIKEEGDILLTTPINALSPLERERATMCAGCSRMRIMPSGQDTCLECLRSEG